MKKFLFFRRKRRKVIKSEKKLTKKGKQVLNNIKYGELGNPVKL